MRSPQAELARKLIGRRKHTLKDILNSPHLAKDIGLAHLARDPKATRR